MNELADGWDWEEQRADTFGTVAHLIAENRVPEGAAINLDIQTVAGPEAGPLGKAAYLSALAKAGYTPEVTTDDDGTETIEITVEGVPFDAEAIWAVERTVTDIALAHQWVPEGWGFWEP